MALAHVQDEIVTQFRLVCQLCDNIFEKDIPIACVHLTFCRRCLEKNGLPDDHDLGQDTMVCTRCSVISPTVTRGKQWDSQQNILSSMHLRAKCRRGLLENCDNPDVNSLCKQLNEVVINGSTSSSTPSLPGSPQSTHGGGTKPCLGSGCKTCALVVDIGSVSGPSGIEKTVNVDGNFTCRSKRVIYYIYCTSCQKGYVGKTTQKLQDRMSQHCRDIKQGKARSSVANHFNLHENSFEVLRVCVVKSFPPNTSRRTMLNDEKDMISRIGTTEPYGMNKE